MVQIPQSTARVVMLKVFETGTTTAATGKTVAVTLSKAGGAFANPNAGATTATEVSSGWYKVTLDATDTGTLGDLAVRGTATGCDDAERLLAVVKATTGGLTGIPDAAAGANGGLPVLSSSGTTLAYTVSTLTTYTGNTPQTGDAFARVGANGAGLTALGDSRIAYLDAAISSLNNLSALQNLYASPLMEIPDSGTTQFAFTLVVRDNEGKLKDLDASPTIAAANAAGTSRSANLSAVAHPGTGRYTWTYGVASTAAAESLRVTVSGAVSSEARYVEWVGAVVNYDTLTTLAAVKAKTDQLTFSFANALDVNVTLWNGTGVSVSDTLGLPVVAVRGVYTGAADYALNATADVDLDALAYLDASVQGVADDAGSAATASVSLLSRLTSTRAGYLDNLSGGAVATAASLATLTGYVDTEVAAIKAKTDLIPAAPAAVGDIPTAAAIVAATFARLIETGVTFAQLCEAVGAALAGQSTGSGTATEVYKAIGNPGTTRITLTADEDGNRTGVALNL